MTKKTVPLILLAVAAIGAGVYYGVNGNSRSPAGTVQLSGNIEAHESVVGFKVPGRLAELPVEEGQEVRAGDLLARLDQGDYRQQVAIDTAILGSRQAELDLAMAGSRAQEKQAAAEAVADAKAALELSRAENARYQELFARDVVSAQDRDAAATALQRAQAAYERARQNYDLVREGVRREQIEINRAAVRAAGQALELARIRLGYTTLTAPTAGVVLVRQAELGEVVAAGTPVVTIADLNRLWLRAYLNETDLGRVKLGQPVKITSDTFPGKTYRGRVSFIAGKAEFTPKSVETHKERVTLVYRVKIEVENPNRELKPGMPADAVIDTGAAR